MSFREALFIRQVCQRWVMRKVVSRKFQPQIGPAWLISKWTLVFFLRQGWTPLRTFSLNLVSSLLLRQGFLSISCQTKTSLMWRINYTRLTEASISINTFKFTWRRSMMPNTYWRTPPPQTPRHIHPSSPDTALYLFCCPWGFVYYQPGTFPDKTWVWWYLGFNK